MHDTLGLKNLTLHSFNFSVLGNDVNIATIIDSISITGLKALTPQHVNNSDKSATADLMFVLGKPTLYADVEANMYGCAPDVSESECSNLTIADLPWKLEGATTKRQYFKDAPVKSFALDRFKDAPVKSFALDLESISGLNSTLTAPVSLSGIFCASLPKAINKKTATNNSYIATINRYAPAVLNI
ncbi:hypothetical protein PHMEG_00031139 [Phytophthora megakarya]|uniref:Uncharacterized protein n=1 Tax=Phytophthora megakarya TaxID=4795 RepID=A0A225UYW3_9STRA|nr:hypothetical protein PHMEG_00031139 [Phytophthora megakarya]